MKDGGKGRAYEKIAKAIEFISRNQLQQPSLAEIALELNLSEYHMQRLFSEWVGVSPKQFLMYQTKEYAKQCLQQSSVFEAALDSGLSGAGRLHDLMLTCEGMTPGEYKKQGDGLQILYGVHGTPFGCCLLATTSRGVCKVSFFDRLQDEAAYIKELELAWPKAELVCDERHTARIVDRIFNRQVNKQQSIHLLLKGTPFQLQVWEALLSIPESSLYSYQHIAQKLGAPSSVRAVASAIAKNNLAYLIPCHRVIKSTGEFNQYRWGESRKKAMIIREAASNN